MEWAREAGQEFFEKAAENQSAGAPRGIGSVEIGAVGGKADAARGGCGLGQECGAGIRPGAGCGREGKGAEFAPFAAGGEEGLEGRVDRLGGPRRQPFVDGGRILQKLVNRPRGGTAKNVDFKIRTSPAHEGETEDGIAEVVELDEEEAGFYGKGSHGGGRCAAEDGWLMAGE